MTESFSVHNSKGKMSTLLRPYFFDSLNGFQSVAPTILDVGSKLSFLKVCVRRTEVSENGFIRVNWKYCGTLHSRECNERKISTFKVSVLSTVIKQVPVCRRFINSTLNLGTD